MNALVVRGLLIITKSALLLGVLSPAAIADCVEHPLAQLRVVTETSTESAIQGIVATANFPALSESGKEVAILLSTDAHQSSAILEIRSVVTKGALKRFELIAESEPDWGQSDLIRQRVEADMVEPNTYLTSGKFTPMETLFTLVYPSGSFPYRINRGQDNHGLNISIDYTSSKLNVSSLATGDNLLEIAPPLEKSGPLGGVEGHYCYVQGLAEKGWISEARGVIVIYLNKTGGRDSCDHPADWVVERLPEQADGK